MWQHGTELWCSGATEYSVLVLNKYWICHTHTHTHSIALIAIVRTSCSENVCVCYKEWDCVYMCNVWWHSDEKTAMASRYFTSCRWSSDYHATFLLLPVSLPPCIRPFCTWRLATCQAVYPFTWLSVSKSTVIASLPLCLSVCWCVSIHVCLPVCL